jgi:hypothetical protein
MHCATNCMRVRYLCLFSRCSMLGTDQLTLGSADLCFEMQHIRMSHVHCQTALSHVLQRRVGIPKLDDANDAGSRSSDKCTLILTEGDSAKALAISGLSVVGRDHYGVFPLRGKLLNVRDASSAQVFSQTVLLSTSVSNCAQVSHEGPTVATAVPLSSLDLFRIVVIAGNPSCLNFGMAPCR